MPILYTAQQEEEEEEEEEEEKEEPTRYFEARRSQTSVLSKSFRTKYWLYIYIFFF